MIIPRIILLGDTARASAWIGAAKELVRQTYKAGLRNKTYKNASVEIHIENYLPVNAETRGWSKAFIKAGELADFLAVTWRPVGLMLTPQPGIGPQGFGFPKRGLSVLNIDPETQEEYLTGGELINPPFGTYGATKLHQVIINQYANNRYLDRKEYIEGLPTFRELLDQDKIISSIIPFPEINRRLRASIETEVVLERPVGPQSYLQYWPLFFCPLACNGDGSYWYNIYTDSENPKFWIDEPGLNHWLNPYRNEDRDPLSKHPICYNPFIDETAWRQSIANGINNSQIKWRQFDTFNGNSFRLTELIDEPESGTWHCHWPEEMLYDNDAYEMIFYLTNLYRSQVGVQPVHREIRGFANTARMAIAESQRAEILAHDSDDYRQGYKEIIDRLLNATSNIEQGGENQAAGFSKGLSIQHGRSLAEAWRHSPGHYANMVYDGWTTQSTAHEIFGGFLGVAKNYEPEIKGAFWSQILNKREYWVIAGSVNQQTDAGRVSFFCANSPIGEVYPDEYFFYCHQGRKFINQPALALVQSGYWVSTIGAALYYKNNEVHIRLVLYTRLPTRLLISATKQFGDEGCGEWGIENVYNLNAGFVQDICFFNHTGSEGVITTLVRDTGVADYLLPYAVNQVQANVFIMRVIRVVDGIFSVQEEISGPETTQEVVTDFYTDGGSTTEWVKSYTQSGSGSVNYHPFYKHSFGPDGKPISSSLEYLTYTMDYLCEQTRSTVSNDAPQTFTAQFHCYDFLEFPSGRKVDICRQEVVDTGDDDTLVLVGDCYTVIFLYIDPQYEDMVYAKIIFRSEGQAIYGRMIIYAYYDQTEVSIKEFDEILIDSVALQKPRIRGAWGAGNPRPSTFVTDVINPMLTRGQDISGRWYPLFDNGVTETRVYCSNAPSYYIYPGKIKVGTHKADLFYFYGSFHACSTSDGAMNSSYPVNIPITNENIDGVICNAARYKDRFVVQIKFTIGFPTPMWKFVSDQRYVIYANFPLASEVGVPLAHIDPFGVV